MNKKIAKLAKVFHDEFNEKLQDIYEGVMKLIVDNREYFGFMSPLDAIQMVYYIYSLKKTGGFELGEKIFSEVYLAQFFDYSKSNPHKEQCDSCNGDGQDECDYCDGIGQVRCGDCDDGKVECNKCDADGEFECDECNGEGTIDGEECEECSGSGTIRCENCDGDGENTCSTCGGDGYESCYECGGSGNETCRNCDGDGEIETSDFVYVIQEWLIFDSDLVNYLQKESAANGSVGNPLEFTKRPTVILINSRKEHGQFDEEVLEDEYYCFKIEPLGTDKLYFDNYGKAPNAFKYSNPILGISSWEEPDNLLRD